MNKFLPTNLDEIVARGWTQADIIIVSGDAYVDHPSFAAAIIGRYLESQGYKVAILAQPDWKNPQSIAVCGKPRLFFGITAGNMDSMVANYTSDKRIRKTDAYSEGGEIGKRPDRAVTVYANLIKRVYPDSILVLGGIEASLRRLSHYDFWSNTLRRSILFDSRADILVYGMGEGAILEIARRLEKSEPLTNIPNTARISNHLPSEEHLLLPSHEELLAEKALLMDFTLAYLQELGKKIPLLTVEPCQNKFVIVESPRPIARSEFDKLYFLPYERKTHSGYSKPVPAYGFVKDSVVSHRGCYGGCSFCALSLHQGKHIISRSPESIQSEITEVICKDPDFTGVIQDIGGPSANMYGSNCKIENGCNRLSCIYPDICNNLEVKQEAHLRLLKTASTQKGVNHVFVSSGIRYDLAIKSDSYLNEVIGCHISGQMSVAPEHISKPVLKLMQKPELNIYSSFLEKFQLINKKYKKKQFTIPYFMSSHPGCTLQDMHELIRYMDKHNLRIKQVQNFIPIPLTLSGAMYYTELDPFSKKKIHVPKGEERLLQRAMLQPWLESNQKMMKQVYRILQR